MAGLTAVPSRYLLVAERADEKRKGRNVRPFLPLIPLNSSSPRSTFLHANEERSPSLTDRRPGVQQPDGVGGRENVSHADCLKAQRGRGRDRVIESSCHSTAGRGVAPLGGEGSGKNVRTLPMALRCLSETP